MEKKKASAAHIRATAKWEKTNYFKTLVRFRADDEDRIRAAAGDSLNGFIVSAVLEAIREKLGRDTGTEDTQTRQGGPEDGRKDRGRIEEHQTPADALSGAQGTQEGIMVDPETVAQLQPYGDPAEIIRARLEEVIEEYRAGIR